MKRALVFQHMDHDHPGRFIDFLAEDGLIIEQVRLFDGAPIPPLAAYDFLFVLGGKQDCWEEHIYPWMTGEKEAIREWVLERAKPYFGVCLGHQLLCDSTGGEVALAAEKEVGICKMQLTEEGQQHPFMKAVPSANSVLQWHMAEVKNPGPHAKVLARSDRAAVQAVAIGDHAMSTQFHCEFSLQTIAGWSSMPEYVEALEKHLGQNGYQRFMSEAAIVMPGIHQATRQMYDNFSRACGLRK